MHARFRRARRRRDWEDLAAGRADPRRDYRSVLGVYRERETWHGEPDSARRGMSGATSVQSAQPLHPFFSAMLADLPGVGANPDDHLLVGCVWGGRRPAAWNHSTALGAWGDLVIEIQQMHEIKPQELAWTFRHDPKNKLAELEALADAADVDTRSWWEHEM